MTIARGAGDVVGVIPARGGSKSIPRKSLVHVGGRSLLDRTATVALASRRLDRVVLSTDDDEIAAAGRSLGLDVPFRRPPELARDDSPMIDVLQHVLEELSPVTTLVVLQPTSPLRTADDVDAAVELLDESGAETVVSVVRVPHNMTPGSLLVRAPDGQVTPLSREAPVLRRQDKPTLYARNGPAVLAVRAEVVARGDLYGEPTVGLEMPALRSVDVDEPSDLALVECLLRST